MSLRCEEDVNECEREECENGGACVNVFGSFLCNCTAGFVGQFCGLRPVVVPHIQAGHSYEGKEELMGIAVVLFVIFTLVVLFVVFRKNCSRNNITLEQGPATAALLHKSNGVRFRGLRAGDGRNLYQEVGPPQVPVRPMAYTPCFQSDSRSNLDKIVDGLGGEHQEMTTFHPESPRILTARRRVVVCSVAPNLPAVSPCRSDCDSIRKNGWDAGTESEWEAAVPCVVFHVVLGACRGATWWEGVKERGRETAYTALAVTYTIIDKHVDPRNLLWFLFHLHVGRMRLRKGSCHMPRVTVSRRLRCSVLVSRISAIYAVPPRRAK